MSYPISPLINGKSYEWPDITVNVLGTPIIGITEVQYAEKQNTTNIYGAGSRPVSRGYGNIETTASITLKMEEVESIQAAAVGNNLLNVPEFDIIVTFVDLSLVTRKHTIKNCRFKNNERNSKQGDTSIDVTLELEASHILWS